MSCAVLSRAVVVDRLDLGFVDLLSHEGWLDHPLSGPREELFWRRSVVENSEPPRSRQPVVDDAVVASYGAVFEIQPRLVRPDTARVEEVLEAIGLGPNGKPWDCRACGFETCAAFAQAAAMGRASLKQCVPYQARRVEEAAARCRGGHADRARRIQGAARPAGVTRSSEASAAWRGSRSCSSIWTTSSW